MFQDPTDDLSRCGGGMILWLAILEPSGGPAVSASSKVVSCKCKTGPANSLGFI